MTQAIDQDLISNLRSQLEARRLILRRGLQHEKNMPERAESDSQDIEASYASDLEQQVDEEIDGQHAIELRQIEAALQRIETGQYGICQDCGDMIAIKRLTAYPAAKRCIDCKEEFEKRPGIERKT